MSKTFTGKHYRIFPLTEAMIIGLGVFFAIFVTTYFIYHYSLNALKEEIKEGLVRSAKIVASTIDGNAHKQFTHTDQEQESLYINAIRPFEKALQADSSIKFLYTVILKDDQVYFILDATPEGDADGDGVNDKAHIMDAYPEASIDVITALKEGRVVVSEEPYTDRWGSFISGFIPFYTSSGEMAGVLGIDIEAKNYFARLAPIKRATVRTMVAGFFIAFIIASLVWFTRNFGKVINRKRLEVISAQNESAQPQCKDEPQKS
jgi:hypothetical protein